MTRIEPPRPRVIHSGVTKLSETRASSPGTLTLMHLQQALANARINVRGDDALNLGALARVRVFVVAIAVIRRDAPGVTRGRARSPKARFAMRGGSPRRPRRAWQGGQEQWRWGVWKRDGIGLRPFEHRTRP